MIALPKFVLETATPDQAGVHLRAIIDAVMESVDNRAGVAAAMFAAAMIRVSLAGSATPTDICEQFARAMKAELGRLARMAAAAATETSGVEHVVVEGVHTLVAHGAAPPTWPEPNDPGEAA